MNASYGISDRVIKLGKAGKAKVKVLNPDGEVMLNEWLFDLLADIKLTDFDFYVNLVRIVINVDLLFLIEIQKKIQFI